MSYPTRPTGNTADRGKEVARTLFNFSGDEVVALWVCGALAIASARTWYALLITPSPVGPKPLRWLPALTPPACLALLYPVLSRLGSHELREDAGYVVLFMLGGMSWLGLASLASATMGISYRDDAVERRNSAAAIGVCGAAAGATLCYAGANIGEGPTIWMTFGPAALATAAWLAVWAAYQAMTNVADTVALDRDAASAARLAGLLVACGLILGRAVAGDYESARRTLEDFARHAWPSPLLAVAAAIADRFLRPTTSRPKPPLRTHGLLLAAACILAALAHVIWIDPWKHIPGGQR